MKKILITFPVKLKNNSECWTNRSNVVHICTNCCDRNHDLTLFALYKVKINQNYRSPLRNMFINMWMYLYSGWIWIYQARYVRELRRQWKERQVAGKGWNRRKPLALLDRFLCRAMSENTIFHELSLHASIFSI